MHFFLYVVILIFLSNLLQWLFSTYHRLFTINPLYKFNQRYTPIYLLVYTYDQSSKNCTFFIYLFLLFTCLALLFKEFQLFEIFATQQPILIILQ